MWLASRGSFVVYMLKDVRSSESCSFFLVLRYLSLQLADLPSREPKVLGIVASQCFGLRKAWSEPEIWNCESSYIPVAHFSSLRNAPIMTLPPSHTFSASDTHCVHWQASPTGDSTIDYSRAPSFKGRSLCRKEANIYLGKILSLCEKFSEPKDILLCCTPPGRARRGKFKSAWG